MKTKLSYKKVKDMEAPIYNCFCPLSVQPSRRYVKTNKEKEDDEKK